MFQQTVGKCDEPHFTIDNAYCMVPGTKQIVNKHGHLLSISYVLDTDRVRHMG